MSDQNTPWEPDRSKMGNWEAMLGGRRQGSPQVVESLASPAPETGNLDDADNCDVDPQTYKPWVIQRGRSHPALILALRRFDAKSGLWRGWGLAHSSLQAVEWLGDKLLNLDFGARQFMIEGVGLDQLALEIQRGVVLGIIEHAAAVWPTPVLGPVVRSIRQISSE